MNRHTPGPWQPHYSHAFGAGSYIYGGHIDADKKQIAHVLMRLKPAGDDGYREDDAEQTAANTRLIAAAPDLLFACKMALGTLSLYENGEETPEIKLLEAAIEKAEGTDDATG